MPFDGAPFDRLHTFLEEYGESNATLTGLSLKEIHKMTLTAVIEDYLNGTNCKEELLKLQLKTLPLSLQVKLLQSIIPSCNPCRNCFKGHQKFESLGNCPIDRYLFWMKTSTTLSTSEKACTTRLKYHYPMFMGGLHKEEFEKEIDE